eukprot:366746_1
MQLFHHHQGSNQLYQEEKHEDHQTCYHCGRQFVKHNGVLHRLKRRHHCPACHFQLEHVVEDDEGSDKKKGGIHIPRFSRSFQFSSSCNKKMMAARSQSTVVNSPAISSYESNERMQQLESYSDVNGDERDGKADNNRMKSDRAESSPFAFTYNTEEVESYQIPHDAEEVESYQLEWLIDTVN